MMTEILAVLSHFIIAVISGGGYAGIVLLMGIESACIPLPSEVIMPFSGYLVAQGRFTLLWVATAGAIGCNVGSAVAYWVGYFGGRRLVLRYGHLVWLTQRELEISEKTVKAHLTRVFSQLGVADRTQAALWAQHHLPSD